MPEAAAADRTSLFRAGVVSLMVIEYQTVGRGIPSLLLMLGNSFVKILAQQHATWTNGPSLPSHMPDATARICQVSKHPHTHIGQENLPNPTTW
jgi:hypothetical protein